MKKTFLLLVLVGIVLTACEKKNEPYQFKGTSEFVYLNGVERPKFKSTTTQYSIAEIVRHSNVALIFRYKPEGSDENIWCSHFADEFRDTINNRLLMQSSDILTEDGRLVKTFLEAHDVYFQFVGREVGANQYGDTCGYIPQSVIDNAREQIEALYDDERYDEIYELFHSAFTFYPCTGEEYKQIVANGGN